MADGERFCPACIGVTEHEPGCHVASQTPPAPPTGGEAVLIMRDQFAQLAKCYLEMHSYDQARDATAMAEALQKFEDQHIITNIDWPPKIEKDEYGRAMLAGNPDTVVDP